MRNLFSEISLVQKENLKVKEYQSNIENRIEKNELKRNHYQNYSNL